MPHGISVVVNAPAVARFTAVADPNRHPAVAEALGADARGAAGDDAGEVLAERLVGLMRETRVPNGLGAAGYGPDDIAALTEGAIVQERLLSNAPRQVDRAALSALFANALT